MGLAPSIQDLGHGEALTASARHTTALFYNPAGLARSGFQVRLFGAELVYDKQSAQQTEELAGKLSKVEEELTVEKIFALLDPNTNLSIQPTVRLFDLTTPFLGASNFARLQLESSVGSPSYNINLRATMGQIAGFAINIGGLSLGVSTYEIQRFDFTAWPTKDQLINTIQDFKNGTFDNQVRRIQNFSQIKLGAASGQNWGLMYHPDPDSPTGLGLAVLNQGGTRFQYISPDASQEVRARKGRRPR